MPDSLEISVRPRSPFEMPRLLGADGVAVRRDGVLHRLLTVSGSPVLVRAWQRRDGEVSMRADAIATTPARRSPRQAAGPGSGAASPAPGPRSDSGPEAGADTLELALSRIRFAIGVDRDMAPFHRRFRRDPLLGPAIRKSPRTRVARRPWPWEALAWAVTEQLIEYRRAAAIQRRIVRSWGRRADLGAAPLFDPPGAETVAGLAPAELERAGLSAGRAVAMRRAAREVASGRCDPGRADDDVRLTAIRGIGAWTVRCLGLFGRGDDDALPSGDLNHLKVVGMLARLGRLATADEVEEFYSPYEPYRGLAATIVSSAHGGRFRALAGGPVPGSRRRPGGAGDRSGAPSVGDVAGQVLVGEHLRRPRPGLDQAV